MIIATRDEWEPGETAEFYYSLAPDPSSDISSRLAHRDGQVVVVLAENESDGQRVEFPTFNERADAGMLLTYRVRFPDGHEDDAFEDELHDFGTQT